MTTRLISVVKSKIKKMTAQELKFSIQAAEGRVIFCQNYVGLEGVVRRNYKC
jgi:hypothetical protein